MSEQQKFASCESDAVMARSAVKRKYQPEMSDFHSKESGNDGKTTAKFNDMCDHVIDVTLCNLHLEDLANISDTSARLRGIASSVFSRKHAHRLISMDVYRYKSNPSKELRENYKIIRKHDVVVRISDAKTSFQLLRNFGASIKHVRIHSGEYGQDIVLQNLIRYVSDFCSDSLETLDVQGYRFLTLNKPLTNLREFYLSTRGDKSSEALDLMPNVRTLRLYSMPKTMAKSYANVERIHLAVESDEEVQTFISFIRLNRQIIYLSLIISYHCRPEHNNAIYSSIADNLTQLTTFKLYESNRPQLPSRHRFEGVETFSAECYCSLHMFEFNDLRTLTLRGVYADPTNCLTIARRNKNLKILKLLDLSEVHLNANLIQNLLNDWPELEEIIVDSDEKSICSVVKNLLGREWERFEKKKVVRFRPSRNPESQHFRKKKLN